MWEAKPHQIELARKAQAILNEYGLVYLGMEERTGKTIISILLAEQYVNVDRVLVITTKKALEGWQETLVNFPHSKIFVVINYHSVQKAVGPFQFVILDEAHKYISGYPKTSGIWKNVFKLVYGLPIVYSSATPYAQGTQLLFHQFYLSHRSPWKQFKNFYDWFRYFADRDEKGALRTNRISATAIAIDYTKVLHDKVKDTFNHLFITATRKELGFEHEPEDQLHFIKLSDKIRSIYNTIVKEKGIAFTLAETGKDYTLVCDTSAKLRWALHMIEGGTLKIGDEYVNLGNNEKADYILQTWGDVESLVIMYHFKADKLKLEKMFKKATILQASSYAEGVDLSSFKTLVIYSQNHSTSQHTQRRARQANMRREEKIIVHYILVKGAASHKAYKAVSLNKKNFVDTVFETL
ncbi:MAG: hypothetical protein EOM35_02290 [Negativicutes bacterium]|nr:hypothetical protein [Negativicutes bacterium]